MKQKRQKIKVEQVSNGAVFRHNDGEAEVFEGDPRDIFRVLGDVIYHAAEGEVPDVFEIEFIIKWK